MKIDVCFTPAELAGLELAGKTAVVIDALRATSTIVVALANGARAVYPAGSIDDAVRLIQNTGRDGALLCGERRCVRPDGFDLGNSPLEFTAERVDGKLIAFTTTNGTAALQSVSAARETLVAAYLNLGAMVEALEAEEDVVIVCAGRERRLALEDAVCAGMIVRRLRERGVALKTADGAAAAVVLARQYGDALPRLLAATAAGRQLAELGLEADVELCAELDRYTVVPRVRDRQVVSTVSEGLTA